ncbi:MAG: hypothetical protein CL908_25245 [Deltaproteobacteria bacterium]|nr:hypothetical protein [Deltaproteobacteria bacterium]
MRHATIALLFAALLAGCVSTGTSGSQPTAAGDGKAVKIKHDDTEVPAAVRAIETQIDRPSALMGEEVEIWVSKNYEWDISLTGDLVKKPEPDAGGGQVSIATGHPRARFRNLEIRAWKKIIFHRSGFGVTPYIKITARGRAAHAILDPGSDTPVVRRAPVIRIRNADIQYLDRPGGEPSRFGAAGVPGAGHAGASELRR